MRKTARTVLLILLFALALTGTFLHGPVYAESLSDPVSLQRLIDQAESGDTIVLHKQIYEGPAVISKSLILRMEEGGRIVNQTDQPAITLAADGITLQDLHVLDNHTDPKLSSILINSDHNLLVNLVVNTQAGGIYLRHAHDNEIRHNVILGIPPADGSQAYSKRGNGIDLLASSRNLIEGNTIDHMHDGVYAESSNNTTVINNRVDRSRYGYHLMFSGKPVVSHNQGSLNVTGAMVMGVEQAIVSHNHFDKQNENVNSQGILLYDVHHSQITDNRVEGNRVGLYMENASNNQLERNEVIRNFIGLQLLSSNGNQLTESVFISNVVQAQSTDSKNNELNGNYWDDHQGLDLQADGISDLPYELDPFFLKLTENIGAYQIFFQSPGIPFLQQMFHTGTGDLLRDERPLMAPPYALSHSSIQGTRTIMFLLGLVLLLLSITAIYKWGYKRDEKININFC